MTHVVAGFPSKDESEDIVRMMARVGADAIEIQIPFSDPVADGPTMMECNEQSLARGFAVDDAFLMAKQLSAEKGIPPLFFMTYYNIVFQRGVKRFCKEAKEAGIFGLIVPDMPIDEEKHEGFLAACKDNHLAWIPVVSPITSCNRLSALSKYANGFWYVVSQSGVTGVRDRFSHAASSQIQWIREHSSLPIALAFGVSAKEHVRAVATDADMAVIGSAVQNFFLRSEHSFSCNLHDAEAFLRKVCKT